MAFLLFLPIFAIAVVLLMKIGIWAFAVAALVIVFDLILGLRYRPALIFGIAQVLFLGLAAGMVIGGANDDDLGAAQFMMIAFYLWVGSVVAFHLHLVRRWSRSARAGRDG